MTQTDFETLLAGAEHARTRPLESEDAIRRALEAAPHDPDVRLAAYRFHFYSHNHKAALGDAEIILVHAARRLNLPTDWRDVTKGDHDFTAVAFAPGLYLQALIAIWYCAARIGHERLARDELTKASDLDPSDRFGGAWLLGLLDRSLADEED